MLAETLTVTSEMLAARLDRLLAEQFPHHSRTYFQSLIEQGFVLVNGLPMKKKDRPSVGDEIEICFQLTPAISLEPENIPLDILHEDEHLIAVNKPIGMVVHPAPGHSTGTFVHALLYHCKQLPFSQTLRPGIVHRLDKETSGVLIAAKTVTAHQKLVEMFCERKLEKIYLAICVGSPGDKEMTAPIKRHPTKRQQMCVDPAGKPAISRCRTLASEGPLSLVEIELVTGRTHQIRVHLQHEKTPVLGDTVYGLPSWNQKFQTPQLLHACQLKLLHPITSAPLHFLAPIPDRFKKFNFTEILDK